MINRPDIKNTLTMPSGKEMFRWGDGIFRETPEQTKPKLNVVEGFEIQPRNISPAERGRYRTVGRVLSRIIAGETRDPRLIDKLIPSYASKQAVREASQHLIRIASEGSKPHSERDRKKTADSVEAYLQTVGIRTVGQRRELAILTNEFMTQDLSTIHSIEKALHEINEKFPPITRLSGLGNSWQEPNPNKAAQIMKGQLEQRRNELIARSKKGK